MVTNCLTFRRLVAVLPRVQCLTIGPLLFDCNWVDWLRSTYYGDDIFYLFSSIIHFINQLIIYFFFFFMSLAIFIFIPDTLILIPHKFMCIPNTSMLILNSLLIIISSHRSSMLEAAILKEDLTSAENRKRLTSIKVIEMRNAYSSRSNSIIMPTRR